MMVPTISIQSVAFITSFSATGQNLMPLVAIALMIDAGIIAIWYYLGTLLNSNSMKGSAKGEFMQLIGTAVIAALIIGALAIEAGVFTGILNSTQLMSNSAMTSLCSQIEQSNSGAYSGLLLLGPTDSLLAGNNASSNAFPGICNMLSPSTGDVGSEIDYPLAASAVVIANLTNQSAGNLNALFYVQNFVMFLNNLKPTTIVCFGECILPTPVPEVSSFSLSYAPYAGYGIFRKFGNILGTLTTAEVESLIIQLIIISIVLAAWPYLLFAGLILRATFFTRKLGGTLIAIAIGAILFTPLLLSTEYLTLSGSGSPLLNQQSSAQQGSSTAAIDYNSTYGFLTSTRLPGRSCATGSFSSASSCTDNYSLNFFILPSYQAIANANGCWHTSIIGTEVADLLPFAVPGVGLLSGVLSGAGLFTSSSIAQPLIPFRCSSTTTLHIYFQLMQAAAIGGIAGYFLPLIDIIIVFAGVKGLAGLMGGDTEFAGLGKLI